MMARRQKWVPQASGIAQQNQAPAVAKVAAGEADLAYRMQKWPRYLYKSETAEGGFLNEALELRKEGTWPAIVRELFGRLYGVGTHKIEETPPGNEWAEELHRQADAVPEWQQLEQQVRGDAWRAAMGAGQVASILAPSMPELPDENAGAMEAEAEMMRDLMQGGRVNANLMEHAPEGAVFLHCLPAHRGEEVTDDVMDGHYSAVIVQAANRMHVQKGLLAWLLNAID